MLGPRHILRFVWNIRADIEYRCRKCNSRCLTGRHAKIFNFEIKLIPRWLRLMEAFLWTCSCFSQVWLSFYSTTCSREGMLSVQASPFSLLLIFAPILCGRFGFSACITVQLNSVFGNIYCCALESQTLSPVMVSGYGGSSEFIGVLPAIPKVRNDVGLPCIVFTIFTYIAVNVIFSITWWWISN